MRWFLVIPPRFPDLGEKVGFSGTFQLAVQVRFNVGDAIGMWLVLLVLALFAIIGCGFGAFLRFKARDG